MARLTSPALMLCLALLCAPLAARSQSTFNTGADNLMAVLRESSGSNKQDEALQPYGTLHAQLADGREVDIEASWFHYLGDMHIRLVFDGPQSLQSVSPDDLARLHLSPQEALERAAANLRRVYGVPAAHPWSGALMQVQGEAQDLNSSYFLDRAFWQALQERHPQGVVAAVPRRGGLVYAAVEDEEAVAQLRFSATALYASGEQARVSSALYLFKDNRWSVFQPPLIP